MDSELETGRQLRDLALESLEERRKLWIQACRKFAINHAKRIGKVSINDVRACFELPAGYHPNTWGTILHCKELQAIGFTQANHKDAHARTVRIFGVKNGK